MKLSIIVPVYNSEKYLRTCLDSLVRQSIEDYEIILINDGSKDSSEAILEEYRIKHPNLIKYFTVENGGQGRARNIGIEKACGEFIGFADSDDWVDPSMYEKLYNAAVGNNADIAICDCFECYDDGRKVYSKMTEYAHPMHVTTAVWNKLFKRELAQSIKFPQGLWYEDITYVIEAMLGAKKIALVHEALYFYRIGQVSTMTNNNSKKNLDVLKIMDGLKCKMLPERKADFDILLVRHVLLDTINRVAAQRSSDKKQVIEELLDYIHEEIPYLPTCAAYKAEPFNRRLIMFLNYNSMERVSQLVFKTKSLLS